MERIVRGLRKIPDGKKKKAPPFETKLRSRGASRSKSGNQTEVSAMMIAGSRGTKGGNFPTRVEVLHDDREGLGMAVTILAQRISGNPWASV